MADPSLLERFQAFRAENQAAVQAANKPNLMGVRPASAATYQNAPGENLQAMGRGIADTAQGFVDNRRAAVKAQRNPAPPVTAPVAPPTPGASATPPSPVPGVAPPASIIGNAPGAVPTADLSRQVSPDRQDPTVARRGERNAFEQPLLNQGYQPAGDSLMVRTQGATTDYQTPNGSITFQGGVLGVPGRQGGGTLSVVGGRTAEEQAGIDERVASINRQTEALRQSNIETGRSYAPESGIAPVTEAVDLFARPGDRFGDSQMRAAAYDSLISDSTRARDPRTRVAALAASEKMLEQGKAAEEQKTRQQASRDSLLGNLAQAGATQSAAQLQAGQKMQEARARLGLDERKADQEMQIKGGELSLNALKTYQGMGEAQQQQAKADLYNAYKVAVDQGDQATMTKLQPLMDYLYPQKQQNDSLAALLQRTPK